MAPTATYYDKLIRRSPGLQHRANVQRIRPWLSHIFAGIETLKDDWGIWYKRQLWFTHEGDTYIVKYDHHAGRNGGVLILYDNKDIVRSFQSLGDAVAFEKHPSL